MEKQLETTLQKLIDKEEIREVMYRWCRIVDRCDWSSIYDVFHQDGHDDHGLYSGDVDGMVAWLSERHLSVSRSMHLVGNMHIEFADHNNALVESYSFALQRYPGGGGKTGKAISGGKDTGTDSFDMLMSGRYVDHFQKRNGVWKILDRTVVFDNSLMFPVPQNAPELNDDWSISTRGKDDPIWAMRAKIGL